MGDILHRKKNNAYKFTHPYTPCQRYLPENLPTVHRDRRESWFKENLYLKIVDYIIEIINKAKLLTKRVSTTTTSGTQSQLIVLYSQPH